MTPSIHTVLFILLLSLTACFKKEDPIALPAGNSEINSFSLGKGYEKEVFFDLSTNSFQERRWADWDICFDASKDGYGVFINTGKSMSVRKINLFGLKELSAIDTLFFKNQDHPELVDPPEGDASKAAMGDWRTYKNQGLDGIYVVELKYNTGYDRFKRIQVIKKDDTAYFVRVTDLFDLKGDTVFNAQVLTIPKNPNQNFTYYSFSNNNRGIIQNAEPDKNNWDFVFTRYTHFFYDILPNKVPFPYKLSGVFSSTNHVEIARDSAVTAFEDIDAGSIPKYQFTKNRNGIGYDWKTHAQSALGSYSITPRVTYIIKDTDGYYYKLRFLDYNNELGEPGYPKFEFIRIK